MARRPSSSLWFSPLSSLFLPRGDTLWYILALLSIFSLLIHHLSVSSLAAADSSHFEGFDADDDETLEDESLQLTDLPLRSPPPPTLTQSDPESHHGPPNPKTPSNSNPPATDSSQPPDLPTKPSSTSFDYWDEDEFEGLPVESQSPPETTKSTENATPAGSDSKTSPKPENATASRSYTVEIACVSFLIMFIINYFTGKKENENIALAWAAKFATDDSIFEKNFSLLGVGEGKDSPLLLKEGHNVFKFYASGRRFCQRLLATMELQSRHDLISRLYNMIVPCKDEITFEVYMNDDAMDQVVFALAKKKAAKTMQKEVRDLQRFSSLVSPPSNRKWVVEDLAVISESKEVAGDLITEAVLDQVFGEKAFEKFGKGFISMHFSDQHLGTHKKMLMFKFALPDANHMADMTRLVALVPYYIDLIGRYKLSSQAQSKTEAARLKAAQEAYKEYQNARQEALQKKKADRRKMVEEAEAKLSAEAIRKKEAKERARQMKKAMPKVKMTRAG
uniref:Coiled-coil domain-containing protein 47 n=1 Tax=Davidia involucrata TaxID=16924 RepID=A0A5B6YH25_DAVIN